MRYHRRTVMQVEIDLDDAPGWGYQPEDHVEMLQRVLRERIPHYNPSVTLLSVERVEHDHLMERE